MRKKLIIFLSALLPIPLFAATDFNLAGSQFKDVLSYIVTNIAGPLTYLLDGIAFIIFFYGLIKFVIKADNEDELKKGKQYMLWGIIALFVLISFTSLINILEDGIGLGKSTAIPVLSPQ